MSLIWLISSATLTFTANYNFYVKEKDALKQGHTLLKLRERVERLPLMDLLSARPNFKLKNIKGAPNIS